MKKNIWSKADIHIHTRYSGDATASVEGLLRHVVTKTDLRVIAITDHDVIEGALLARRLAPAYEIDVIVGEEVSTADGHLLALFIEEWLPPGRPAAETIAAVQAQGGICIAPHPYGWLVPSLGWNGLERRTNGPLYDWPLDGVEALNASLWLSENNTRATVVGRHNNLALCGGSDSHHLSTVGSAYTLFPGQTADDLRQAILARQTHALGGTWGWDRTSEYLAIKVQNTLRGVTDRTLKPTTQ